MWSTPFIITRNSARWLGPVLQFYRDAGMEPRILLDETTDDGTEAVLKRHGARYRRVTPSAPRVEAMIKEIAVDQPSGWALRMDDDELPCKALIAYLSGPPPSANIDAIALARWYLWRAADRKVHRGEFAPGNFIGDAMQHDWQWRLFRTDRVKFVSGIHTPGFEIPARRENAPETAMIAHLVWIVHTSAARRAKVKAYDAQKPGAGSYFHNVYVPEDAPTEMIKLKGQVMREFDRVVSQIALSTAPQSQR